MKKYLSIVLAAAASVIKAADYSAYVLPDTDSHLIYQPAANANRVPDFSHVGYKGGTVPIPAVPVKATVSPVNGDDAATIQAAINQVSALPLDATGFRGAVLLTAGEYQISNSIAIKASGVVLRGVGDSPTTGTRLRATGTSRRTLIQITGTGSRSIVSGTTRNLVGKYIPVGARSFQLDSTSGLAVGHTVIVRRPSTQNWINDINMDLLDNPWTAGSKDLYFDRVITRIEGKWITVDAPLCNAFESKYGGGTIYRYTWSGRIQNVGVESIYGFSDYASSTDENHSWAFLSLANVQHAWVRDITAQYFANNAVLINGGAQCVTVENSRCLDPISVIDGGRRYSFSNQGGELCLFKDCYARKGRHDFVLGASVPGPNAFVDSQADTAYSDTGPHHRWSAGCLFDNITVNGNTIDAENRGNLGTGHGWAGANMVFWNSTANGYRVQNPPTAQNWLIGSLGSILGPGSYAVGPAPAGTYDSHGTNVFPSSIYYAQLQERLANPGVAYREYWLGDIDNCTRDGVADDVYVDPTWRSQVDAATAQPLDGFDVLAGNHWLPFTFLFNVAANERVVRATLTLGLRATGGLPTNDVICVDSLTTAFSFSNLAWTPIPTAGTTARVLDLNGLLALLQDGKLNVAINDDTSIDWAVLNLQVAPILSGPTATLYPVADAFVRDGSYSNTNYGASTILTTKKSSPGYNRDAYLRFDLTGVTGTVVHAKVRLTPTSVGQTGIENGAAFVAHDNWAETTITWSNRPSSQNTLATWTPQLGKPVEFHLTPQALEALASDKKLSLRVYSLDDVGGPGNVDYGAREQNATANRPQLIIRTQ